MAAYSYKSIVEMAQAAGATFDEIVGVLDRGRSHPRPRARRVGRPRARAHRAVQVGRADPAQLRRQNERDYRASRTRS